MNKRLKDSLANFARSDLEEDHVFAANLVWSSFSIELKKSVAIFVVKEGINATINKIPDFLYVINLEAVYYRSGRPIYTDFKRNFFKEMANLIEDFTVNLIENAKP